MSRAEAVAAEDVRPLRLSVLRNGRPPEAAAWAGDDRPTTAHRAVRDEAGHIVAVGTVQEEAHPDDPRPGDWRVRGMATDPAARGRGHGTVVLDALLAHARAHGAVRIWAAARVPALTLYERAGFVAETDVYDVPGKGPHVRMVLPGS